MLSCYTFVGAEHFYCLVRLAIMQPSKVLGSRRGCTNPSHVATHFRNPRTFPILQPKVYPKHPSHASIHAVASDVASGSAQSDTNCDHWYVDQTPLQRQVGHIQVINIEGEEKKVPASALHSYLDEPPLWRHDNSGNCLWKLLTARLLCCGANQYM